MEDKTIKEFIEYCTQKHNSKYDYSKVSFKKLSEKIEIICPEHGSFFQIATQHKAYGCSKCAGFGLNNDERIMRLKLKHGDKYDYSKVFSSKNSDVITIICNKHGEFKQAPIQHKKGKGCIKCKESKGETAVRTFLEKKQIKYIQEYRDKDIYTSNYNRFDFYLPDFNTYIEFQGIQHYKPIDMFGGEESYTKQMYKDLSKMYSVYFSHNAELITIPFYYIDRVDEYLTYCLERFI